MPDAPSQLEALARVDRDIRASEQRITTQTLFIDRMRRHGRDTTHAERLLRNMQVTLQAWHAHRDEILRELARDDKPSAV